MGMGELPDQYEHGAMTEEGQIERIGAILRWSTSAGSGSWQARVILALAGFFFLGIAALYLSLFL